MDMRKTGTLPMAILAGLCLAAASGCAGKTHYNVPSVLSFQPTQGPAGTSVTITGADFTGIDWVDFGDGPSVLYQVNSGSQITATVPENATSGPIVVENQAGIGTSVDNITTPQFQTFLVTPVVTGIAPTSAQVGDSVTITGSGFFGTTGVSIGSDVTGSTTFTYNDQNQLTVKVGANAVTGPVVVTASGVASAPGPVCTVTP